MYTWFGLGKCFVSNTPADDATTDIYNTKLVLSHEFNWRRLFSNKFIHLAC